jgi:Zn-dependent peptidase ImmA (M78 family)
MSRLTSNLRYRQVADIANQILLKANIKSAPVDIEYIARMCDIVVEETDLGDDVSGVLVVHADKAVIACNPNQGAQRKRFTIAHEFGHFALHKGEETDAVFVDRDFILKKYRSNKVYSDLELKQEQEANSFAASILMPKQFIIQEISKDEMKSLPESELISALANTFDVSISAMTFRLSNLNILY